MNIKDFKKGNDTFDMVGYLSGLNEEHKKREKQKENNNKKYKLWWSK